MSIRICPFDGKEFKSGASYRVHKSRFHRGQALPEPESEPVEQAATVSDAAPVVESLPAEDRPSDGSREIAERHSSSSWGWLGLGGAVLAIILVVLFRRRGGGQQ